MCANKNKAYTSQTDKRIKKVYLVLAMVGIGAALAYFIVYPLLVRGNRVRSSAASITQKKVENNKEVKYAFTALSNEYNRVLDKLTAQELRIEELVRARNSATNDLIAAKAESDRLQVALDEALTRNVSMEKEQVELSDEQLSLKQQLKNLQQEITACASAKTRLENERVPAADYQALQEMTKELDGALEQLQQTVTRLQKEKNELAVKQRKAQEDLASIMKASDKKELNREMLGQVVAARLRLLEYDVDYALDKMDAIRTDLSEIEQKNSISGDGVQNLLQEAQQSLQDCIKRLQESRSAQ